jgi:hypothetical protein
MEFDICSTNPEVEIFGFPFSTRLWYGCAKTKTIRGRSWRGYRKMLVATLVSGEHESGSLHKSRNAFFYLQYGQKNFNSQYAIGGNRKQAAFSAGTGITHSEYNHHPDQEVRLFQIWEFPDRKNVSPRYNQKTFDFEGYRNTLQTLVAPHSDERVGDGLWIYQNAWFHRGIFDEGKCITFSKLSVSNGLFAMVIEGKFRVNGVELHRRDALGISPSRAAKSALRQMRPIPNCC